MCKKRKKNTKHCPEKGQLLTKGCCIGKRIDGGLRVFQYQKMQNLLQLTKHILFPFLKGRYRKCWFKCYHSLNSVVEICAMNPALSIPNGTHLYGNKSSTERGGSGMGGDKNVQNRSLEYKYWKCQLRLFFPFIIQKLVALILVKLYYWCCNSDKKQIKIKCLKIVEIEQHPQGTGHKLVVLHSSPQVPFACLFMGRPKRERNESSASQPDSMRKAANEAEIGFFLISKQCCKYPAAKSCSCKKFCQHQAASLNTVTVTDDRAPWLKWFRKDF